MTTGVTPQGFTPKLLTELLADIEAQELANVDPGLDVSASSPIGQINGIFASKLAELWEALATVYGAFDPDASEAVQLDNVCALTGTQRLPAKPSLVTCNVTLDAHSSLPPGSVANVAGQPSNRWISMNTAPVSNTTSAPVVYPVLFQSETNGPFVANAGTLTVITAPVSGWLSVTNPLDAAVGNLIESDTDLRLRRQAELAAAGGSTVPAIRADLLRIVGVLQAYVFENTSLVTDGNGLPGKAIECVIYDGASPSVANNTVAQTIWNDKPSGIQTSGATTATATDSQGNAQTVHFSRPTQRNIYMSFTVTTNGGFPVDGIAQIKAAVVAQGRKVLNLGVAVVALVYKAAALSVAGVVDVPTLTLDFFASPVATANLTIGSRELAVLDTSRILVNGL